MSDDTMSRDELKAAMADYLGDELSPDAKGRFEAALASHADLAAEVDSLRRAMQALRALDDEPQPAKVRVTPAGRLARIGPWRFAAVIALAFITGFVARGIGPAQSPNLTGGQDGPARPNIVPTASDGIGVRYATQYLSQERRSGLSRSLIAYSRAVQGIEPQE